MASFKKTGSSSAKIGSAAESFLNDLKQSLLIREINDLDAVMTGGEFKNTDSGSEHKTGNAVVEEAATSRKQPAMYKVVLLNDDFTPMDFVVYTLQKFFHKSHEEAMRVMLQVHNNGQGLCGLYTRDVAETKMMQVINLARSNSHPLKCVIHKE